MQVWAHRGASAQAPENTLAALALAVEQGADGVELDVQRCADGHLVVCHDETVDRTTDGGGRIVRLTLAQLRELDAGDGQQIPTLREVLQLLAPTSLEVNLELKNSVEPYPGLPGEVVAMVHDMGMAERVWYSSFALETLPQVLDADASARVGLLVSKARASQVVAAARRIGAQAVHPDARLLRVPLWSRTVKAAGLRLHPWTIDRPRDVRLMRQLGCDAVITNRPAEALASTGAAD